MLARRPLYPSLLHRGRNKTSGLSVPRIGVQIVSLLLVVAFVLTSITAMSVYSAYAQVAASLKPRLSALNNRQSFETSRIYDRNGTLLYEFFDAGRRTRVDLDDISPLLIKATIAIEDKTFFSNPGIDYEGILRTLYQSISAGTETGGASTITQQVIKNIVLTEEERQYQNRYERKIKEIILAQELNQQYTKEDVLELYLNEVFYGNLAYGIEAASNVYFNTNASKLTLPQAALLGGLPQLPSKYDPINYLRSDEYGEFLPGIALEDGWLDPTYQLPEDIAPPKWRQIAVLRQMVDEDYISEAEARSAAMQDLRFAPQQVPLNAPHFVFYVRKLLEEKYGKQLVTSGGLNIYTTLDLDIQRMAQRQAAEHIKSLENRNIHNAAVVVMQPYTGEILAMVGSVDYHGVKTTETPGEEGNVLDGQVNVAIRERQPGSALKPFTYLAAMERGMTPATVLWDVPTEFPSGDGTWYAPKNYNGKWNGPVRIRTALANSLNMPAVKALRFAGIDYTLKLLNRVGIKEGLNRGPGVYGLSLTLGGGEVTLLELTTAYNTLASNGRYVPPTSILKITDNDGRLLESHASNTGQQVINPALNSIIVDVLSDNDARAAIWGLDSKLKLSRPAAVKTGTSEDWRDAWTLGFTPYVTIGVWSGNNNNEQTAKVESLQGGGIIWHNIMEELFTWIDDNEKYAQLFRAPFPDGKLVEEFSIPENGSVQEQSICSLPGPFGGYNEELFTREMLLGTTTLSTTQASHTPGPTKNRISGACDVYKSITVVRVSQGSDTQGASYCLPVAGESYPPERMTSITYWNIPSPDPDIRIKYNWSGGGANTTRPGNLQFCTPAMFATPTPVPTTSAPPPVPGAVQMPDLLRLTETQARQMLTSLGIQNVHVDYQDRNRIPDIFDQVAPYSIVSTIPAPGQWIYPDTPVILGVRGPDGQSDASVPAPQDGDGSQPAPPPTSSATTIPGAPAAPTAPPSPPADQPSSPADQPSSPADQPSSPADQPPLEQPSPVAPLPTEPPVPPPPSPTQPAPWNEPAPAVPDSGTEYGD
jgi:peptidoglycan glycosyltransferase